MRNYRNYSDNDVINEAKNVKSIAGLLRNIGLVPVGGNYYTVKRLIQRLKIDTSHWTGQGWNKDRQLKDWSNYFKAGRLKIHLIKLRSHKCEKCLNNKWLDKLIPLEVHHIDGNRTNNELNNLQLLC